jgi:hypothetical protein
MDRRADLRDEMQNICITDRASNMLCFGKVQRFHPGEVHCGELMNRLESYLLSVLLSASHALNTIVSGIHLCGLASYRGTGPWEQDVSEVAWDERCSPGE